MGIKACLTAIITGHRMVLVEMQNDDLLSDLTGGASVYSGMVIYLMVMVMLKHIWVFISTRLKKK